MVDKVRETTKYTSEEEALTEAIDRVYMKYGTDLTAFFRDVYNELTIKRQESYDVLREVVHFDRSRR